jgi:predicted site-specific integrase-resolvase
VSRSPDVASLISTAEAVEILDIDRSAFTRWVQMGRVKVAYRLPGPNGAYLFERAEIERIAAERASA